MHGPGRREWEGQCLGCHAVCMSFAPAVPALHVVSDAGRGVSGGSRGGWVGEKAVGGAQACHGWGDPRDTSEVSDFCPGLFFLLLASLECPQY